MTTSATVQFKRFFDCGRVVRCTLPLGAGRFMHLVVLYGYQGADSDPEQLALTDQLFDAALEELSVVARGQVCMLVGDFNVEPTKIPCLAKGILAGFWVDLGGSWALATGKQPSSTCMREWGSSEILWLGALFLLLLYCLAQFKLTGGFRLILQLGPFLNMTAGLVVSLSRFDFLLSGLLPGCLLLTRVGGLSRLRFGGSGRFVMIVCSLCLGRMLFF